MRLARILPALIVLASPPLVAFAQTTASAPSSSPAPALVAELVSPASSSSSSAPDIFAAPAQSTPATPPAKPSEGSSGGPFSGLGVGAKVGLAGIGFDVATPLVPSRLNLRGGATFFSYTLNQTTNDNLIINGTLKLQNSGIMLDWFPWRGSFRLSGGATVYNNKGVNATINEPTGSSFTLGNNTYYAATSGSSSGVTGTGNFKLGGNAGGRVSFGWGNLVPKPGHHFSFDTELGIEFVSAPTVALGFSGYVCTSAQGKNCESPTNVSTFTAFQSDVTAEQAKLQNDVNFVKFYPILSFGIGYKIH